MARLKPSLKITGRITAWSFSRWLDYSKCSYKAGLKHVLRLKEPGNEAMDRGTEVHLDAEAYCGGSDHQMHEGLTPVRKKYQKGALPPSLQRIAKEVTAIRKLSPQVEQQWAFDASWVRTGWFDKNCAIRIKIDAYYATVSENNKKVIHVEDFKTGKPRPEEQMPQLELYVLGSFLMFPDAHSATARFLYTEHPEAHASVTIENTPEEVERLKKLWAKRTLPMLSDTQFVPTPSRLCQYCHFRAANGGPCIHALIATILLHWIF